MEYQTKFISETFSRIGITLRDESNEPRSIMISCSDGTVTVPNYPLIVRSKISLAIVIASVPLLWR